MCILMKVRSEKWALHLDEKMSRFVMHFFLSLDVK